MDTETNTLSEQVEVTAEQENTEEVLTNVDVASQDDSAYDKAFESIDLDNPDMSMFTDKTNVVEETKETVKEDAVVEEEVSESVNSDPFALEENGYLVTPLVDRGREVRVTPEELMQFAHKGLNYEEKNKELKEVKPVKQLLDGSNVTLEDIQSLVDLSSGNKEALKHLISKYDVDVYDVDQSEAEYTPVVEPQANPVDAIWSDFQATDPSGAEQVVNTFNTMDEGFRDEVYNEQLFPLFIDDVKTGTFDKVYGETSKIKALNPKVTWLQAYSEAVNRTSQKRPTVPNGVNIPRDNNPSSNVDHRSKADDIWASDDAYNAMMESMN